MRHANNLKKFNERVEIEPESQFENAPEVTQNINLSKDLNSLTDCHPCIPIPGNFHPFISTETSQVVNLTQNLDSTDQNLISENNEPLEKPFETILSDLSSEEVDKKTDTVSETMSEESSKDAGSNVESSKVQSPEVQSPIIQSSEGQSSEVQSSEVDNPKVQSPKAQSSAIQKSKVHSSKDENSKVETEQVGVKSSETGSDESSSEHNVEEIPSPIQVEIQPPNFDSTDSDLPFNPLLENVTETETSLGSLGTKLTSYDALELSEVPNFKKRNRQESKDSENFSIKKRNLVNSDNFPAEDESDLMRGESTEEEQSSGMTVDVVNNDKYKDLLSEDWKNQIIVEVVRDIWREIVEVRKLAILESGIEIAGYKIYRRENSDSENGDFDDQMSICIKMPYENEELFDRIQSEIDLIKQNMMFEKGIMLKLNELTKEMLQFVCSKFEIEIYSGIKHKKIAELRQDIKEFIRLNHRNWNKSSSGEYLFYSVFQVKRTKTIHELSLPELKCLASSLNLFNIVYLSKAKLLAAILKHMSENLPLHPRNEKNEFIFHPDTSFR